MVRYNLVISCETDNNLETLSLEDDYEWHLSIRCAVCKTVNDSEIIFKGSDHIDEDADCNFFKKCKECSYGMYIQHKVDQQEKNKVSMQGIQIKDKDIFKVTDAFLATFDCYNLEIVNWDCHGLTVEAMKNISKNTSGTIFDDVDLNEKWIEYDEEEDRCCLIQEFTFKFDEKKEEDEQV